MKLIIYCIVFATCLESFKAFHQGRNREFTEQSWRRSPVEVADKVRWTRCLRLRGGAQSYYSILDLSKGPASTTEEVKRAYKKAALRWHPDRVPPSKKKEAEARFKKISEAYEVLSDPGFL